MLDTPRCASMIATASSTLLLAVLLLAGTPATAQVWPQRPVRILVTLGAGSGVDIGTRLFADRLAKRWGQPVVVENRPGGDGLVAIGSFVAANDDHVLLASPTSSFTAHPYVYKNVPYKPSDLQPIARISNTIIAIGVPIGLPVKSLADLVAMARAQPGKLNWAGTTGTIDFLFAGFLKNAALVMSKVPYRNQVEAANDLAAGRIQVNETAYAILRPHLQIGKIKLLAVTNGARAPVLPDLPTVTEAGYPDLLLDGLVGFFGPPDMPKGLRERIAADVKEVSTDPLIVQRLNDTGQISNFGGSDEFQAAVDNQRARVGAAAKQLGAAPTE
jgi:tripartite-type tricarboxylate transporter receptor subunit TctC